MDSLIVVDDSKKGPEPLLGPRPRTNPVLYAGRPAHNAPTPAGAILVNNLFGAKQGPTLILLDEYALMAPEALDALTPEEHRQVYGMLRIRAVVRIDGTLEVSGTFGKGDVFCPAGARC
jgi:hypothetical protein